MREYSAEDAGAPTLVMGHGAGAGEDHPWMRRIGDGLAAHGVHVVTFNFPYMETGRHVPDPGPVLEESFRAAWTKVAGSAHGPLFAGGKSMGGRIASQAAARKLLTPAPVGLVFFGYPLHPPGKAAQRRDRHLPDIAAPMLFLQGSKDPFGTPEEMRELIDSLPGATLELIERGDHSLTLPKKQDPAGQSLDRLIDMAAAWIRTTSAYVRRAD